MIKRASSYLVALVCALAWPLMLIQATPASASTLNEVPISDAVSWEMIYKANLLSGKKQGESRINGAQGSLDLKLSIDGEQAWGLPGSQLFIDLLNNHGSRLNQRLGTRQGIDNIEAPINTLLYQFWLQQNFMENKFSILAGLYDLNSEFYVNHAAALFLLPPFGMGSELAQTGKNGPSIFPVTSMSARFRLEPVPGLYWQMAILDGVPGDPDHPKGTRIRLASADGTLQITELGFSPKPADDAPSSHKLALGAWRYSKPLDDLSEADSNGHPLQRRDQGFYLLAEAPLFRNPLNPHRGLTGFARYGVANADINTFEKTLNAGLIYTGLFAGGQQDDLGLGVAAARTGQKFRDVSLQAGEPVLQSEISYELTYRARINTHFSIQPVLQYIRNVGDPALRNIRVAGVRLEFHFGED